MILHSVAVQVCVTALIGADLVITVNSFLEKDSDDPNDSEFYMVSFVITVMLVLEVHIRLFVEGKYFFYKKTNVIEGSVVMIGFFILITGANVPASVGRVIRPMARVARAMRVCVKAWTRSTHIKRSANQVMARKAEEMFWRFLSDVVLIRSENVVFSPLTGKFDLAKACLNTEVFDELHLPIQVKGGLLEALHTELPMTAIAGRGALDEGDAGSTLRVELLNLLIVVSSDSETFADEQRLKEKKARVVEHFVERLIPKALPLVEVDGDDQGRSSSPGGLPNMMELSKVLDPLRRWMSQYGTAVRNWIRQTIHAKIMRGVDIHIRNIVFQHEDYEEGNLDKPTCIFGAKIGEIRMTTSLSEPVAAWVSFNNISKMSCRHSQAGRGSVLSQAGDDQSKHEMLKNISIKTDRISMFCNPRPTDEVCFCQMLQQRGTKGIHEAVKERLRMKDLMERFRLVVVKARPVEGETPCAVKGEPIVDMYQQHDYVLFPMSAQLQSTLPRFAQLAEVLQELSDFDRVLKLSLSPASLVLDNQQAHSLNTWVDQLRRWLRQEKLLQLRPETRIADVMHTRKHKDDGIYEHWHDEFVRKSVVRQWWLHAFVLVQESVGTRSRNVMSFVELQVRSRRRLEYIELVAHRMRCKVHRGSWRRRRSCLLDILSWRKPAPTAHDVDYIDRLQTLQMRMSMEDVFRSQIEARFVAGKREADMIRSRRGACREWLESMRRILSRDSEEEYFDMGQIVRLNAPGQAGTPSNSEEDGTRTLDDKDTNISFRIIEVPDIGVTMDEIIPTKYEVVIPICECCFLLKSSWDSFSFKKDKRFNPPRYHPRGTRHKLIHVWMCDLDLAFAAAVRFYKAFWVPILPNQIQVSCRDVGARYFKPQTGEMSEALKCEMCPSMPTPVFLKAEGSRVDDSESASAVQEWAISAQVGHVRSVVDTVKILRVCIHLGESTIGWIMTRFVRWLLAEPGYVNRGMAVTKTARALKQIGWMSQALNVPVARHHDQKRTLHIVTRIFELIMGLTAPIQISWSLELECWGIHSTMLQPEWSESEWVKWLEQQAPSFGGPLHGPADDPSRTIRADLVLPPVKPLLRRSVQPPVMKVELLQFPGATDRLEPKVCQTRQEKDQVGMENGSAHPPLSFPSFAEIYQTHGRVEGMLGKTFIKPHILHPEAKSTRPANKRRNESESSRIDESETEV